MCEAIPGRASVSVLAEHSACLIKPAIETAFTAQFQSRLSLTLLPRRCINPSYPFSAPTENLLASVSNFDLTGEGGGDKVSMLSYAQGGSVSPCNLYHVFIYDLAVFWESIRLLDSAHHACLAGLLFESAARSRATDRGLSRPKLLSRQVSADACRLFMFAGFGRQASCSGLWVQLRGGCLKIVSDQNVPDNASPICNGRVLHRSELITLYEVLQAQSNRVTTIEI